MIDLVELQKLIDYKFNNPDFLREALTHKSFTFEQKISLNNNQRMEFLGDAVLELIASQYVYERYQSFDEGELTKIRAAMIRGETLFELAQLIELDKYLYLGKGESQLQGKNQETRLADAFEALIAALYLDGGLDLARKFYLQLLTKTYPDPYNLVFSQNPKGNLQEFTQKWFNERPEYITKSVSGPDHDPIFEIEIVINQKVIGSGRASSRKRAEEDAARAAFNYLINLKNNKKNN